MAVRGFSWRVLPMMSRSGISASPAALRRSPPRRRCEPDSPFEPGGRCPALVTGAGQGLGYGRSPASSTMPTDTRALEVITSPSGNPL